MRVAVETGRLAVRGPAGVCDADVRVEEYLDVGLLLFYYLLELGDLADLLEGKHLVLLVAIDGQTGGVVATILETGQACALVSIGLDWKLLR